MPCRWPTGHESIEWLQLALSSHPPRKVTSMRRGFVSISCLFLSSVSLLLHAVVQLSTCRLSPHHPPRPARGDVCRWPASSPSAVVEGPLARGWIAVCGDGARDCGDLQQVSGRQTQLLFFRFCIAYTRQVIQLRTSRCR